MRMSDKIATLINNMLSIADNGTIDIQRNELASQIGCYPSQINYVISTRFKNEHGYTVESHRGGGGFIRITSKKISDNWNKENYILHVISNIGESITTANAAVFVQNCLNHDVISDREYIIILAAVSDNSLPINQSQRDIARAKILKNIFTTLI